MLKATYISSRSMEKLPKSDSLSTSVSSLPLTESTLSEHVNSSGEIHDATSTETDNFERDSRFWMIFVALCCCTLLSALDLGGIGTAGPTIVHDLHGSDFTWVASAYSLAASMFIPMSGNLSQIFGRRPIVLAGITIFAVGSAVCGSARSLTALILGRAIQGVGSGTTQALASIIVTDIVPLRQRGVYSGVTGMIWTVGSAAGPFLAGGLSQKATWRWLFYLNLPLCAIAFVIVAVFLRLKKPEGDFRDKIAKVDWIGNILLMSSTCAVMLSLTWGGVRFPWNSVNILLPLVLGLTGLAVTLFYESKWPSHPMIPLSVLSNRTSISGYIATFAQGMLTLGLAFYLPTWFQSVRVASPLMSGVLFLPLTATICPWAVVQGLIIAKTGSYRPVNIIGWVLVTVGSGLLASMSLGSSVGLIIFYQLIIGVGVGFLHSTTITVLAPLPLSANGPAVAFIVFLRQFSQAWGVAIWGVILENALRSRVSDAAVLQASQSSTGNQQLAYGIIPLIPTLDPALQIQIRTAFLRSFREVWIAFAICAGVGLLTCSLMKSYSLKQSIDGNWGIDRSQTNSTATEKDPEKPVH